MSRTFPPQHVDPVVARSFAQLAAVAVNKHKLESDPLLVRYNPCTNIMCIYIHVCHLAVYVHCIYVYTALHESITCVEFFLNSCVIARVAILTTHVLNAPNLPVHSKRI